jgi:superfamily I DNA/RNA helicase
MEATWWTQPDQLDEDQRKVVALPAAGDHLVVGPPGSGKTNLLLLRAGYLHRLGKKNITVLTFNRVLKEFLSTGTRATPFDAAKIQTYVAWASGILRLNSAALERGRNFTEVRAQLLNALNNLSHSAIRDSQVECILLDEAQDYTPEEIDTIRRFCKQIFAVGDDRQGIYRAEGALLALEGYCGNPYVLRFNYRNGRKICRVADSIRGELESDEGLEAFSNYDEKAIPSSVGSVGDLSLSEQVDRLLVEVPTQLRAYPTGIIGILAPRRVVIRDIARHIEGTPLEQVVQVQHYESGYAPMTQQRRVILSTIHGAKGLEFRALHLLGMDTVRGFPRERKLVYTAVTRAKTSLSIYHDESLPGYLEQAIESAELREPRLPDLSELFRGDS